MVEYTKPRNQVNELMEIIREKEKTLYYSKWEREGDDRYCMCYLVRYTMPNGKTVDNVARPEDLKLLENEK